MRAVPSTAICGLFPLSGSGTTDTSRSTLSTKGAHSTTSDDRFVFCNIYLLMPKLFLRGWSFGILWSLIHPSRCRLLYCEGYVFGYLSSITSWFTVSGAFKVLMPWFKKPIFLNYSIIFYLIFTYKVFSVACKSFCGYFALFVLDMSSTSSFILSI